MHHLRSGASREWAEFAPAPEGAELAVRFDAARNSAEQTLRLRHRDLKLQWTLHLNGKPLAKLPFDENEMVTAYAVAPGALIDGANELKISAAPGTSDDVLIGEIELIESPRDEYLSQSTIDLTVTDADSGLALPCRLTVLDENGALVSTGITSSDRLAVRPGVVYTADGKASIKLPAGSYSVYAGRGFEYSLDSAAVEAKPGESVRKELKIRREVPTPGFVACDTHIHTHTYSRHGDCSIPERMITLAGEGVELPVSADHNIQIDYDPHARAAGLRRHFTPLIGNEVTTSMMGHFNVFPIAKEAKLIRTRGRDWATLSEDIRAIAGDEAVVVLNHARDVHGGFRPFDARRHLSLAGESLDGWQLPASALEVVNSGAVMSDPMQLYRDWFGLLNRGLRITPVGSSDSHDVSRYIVGQGRTYVRVDDRDPGNIDTAMAMRAFRGGQVLVSYGLLADLTVKEGESIEAQVRVLGPSWVKADRVELYANGVKVREASVPEAQRGVGGMKFETTWSLPRTKHDFHLVAIAWGEGVKGLYWPSAKPYQKTSEHFTAYTLGSSSAIYVDADRSGGYASPFETARQIVESARHDPAAALRLLDGYDEAVAAQAASILRGKWADAFEGRLGAAMQSHNSPAAQGFATYLAAWRESHDARAATRPAKQPDP